MVQNIDQTSKPSARAGTDFLLTAGMLVAASIIALMSSFSLFDQMALFIFLIVMVLNIVDRRRNRSWRVGRQAVRAVKARDS